MEENRYKEFEGVVLKDEKGQLNFFDPNFKYRDIASRILNGYASGNINFTMHYQPQVDINTGNCNAEALLRAQDEDGVYINPVVFTRVVAQGGMLNKLLDSQFEQICADLKDFTHDISPDFRVTINTNEKGFTLDNYQRLKYHLAMNGLSTKNIGIEFLEDTDYSLLDSGLFDYMRSDGVSMYMDDYGTGNSSVEILHKFPFDYVKVPGKYIRNIADSTGNRGYLACIANMCKRNDWGLISENVETAEQLAACEEAGVDTVQGYYYSKPVPACKLVGVCTKKIPNIVENYQYSQGDFIEEGFTSASAPCSTTENLGMQLPPEG